MLKIQEDQLCFMEDKLKNMKADLAKSSQLNDVQCNDMTQKINDLTQQLEDKKAIFSGSFLAGIFTEIEHAIKTTRDNILDISHSSKVLTKINKSNRLDHNDIVEHLAMTTASSQTIICHVNRIQYMAKNLSQLAQDQDSIDLKSFNLKEYINKVIESLHPKIKNTNITINTRDVDNIELHSNPAALARILAIFIANSTTHGFNGKGGNIDLSAKMEQDKLILQYQDNGKGISQENLQKIYNPFFTTSDQGTGLGMYVAQTLVTRILKGSIDCESHPGKGVVFSINLPT